MNPLTVDSESARFQLDSAGAQKTQRVGQAGRREPAARYEKYMSAESRCHFRVGISSEERERSCFREVPAITNLS